MHCAASEHPADRLLGRSSRTCSHICTSISTARTVEESARVTHVVRHPTACTSVSPCPQGQSSTDSTHIRTRAAV